MSGLMSYALQRELADTRRQLATATEALRAINNVGCANSHVVKSYVDWGLGRTDKPTLAVPPPALVDWRLPTYPGTERPITPGDIAGLAGGDVSPDYQFKVVEVSWTDAGWTIWDTDGNDRHPTWLRYIGGEE